MGLGMAAFFLFALLVLILGLVLPIWSIVDCAGSRRSGGLKAFLLIPMVLTWSLGTLLYGLILPTTRALRVAASIGLVLLLVFAFVAVPQFFKTAKVVQKEQIQVRARETRQLVSEFKPQPLPAGAQVGSFSGVWYRMGPHFRETALLAAMSATGPDLASAHNLDTDILQVATDPETGQVFGMTNHKFGRIDPKTGKLQEIPVDEAFANSYSWLKGLAYEPGHKRMIILCSHVTTSFFAYDPAGQKREQIGGELRDLPLVGLTYEPEEGAFYALGFDGTSRQIRTIHRFNAAGAEIGRVNLASPIPMPGGIDFSAQIHAAGELLALVLAPMSAAESGNVSEADGEGPRLLFVSPKSGVVYLAAQQK